MSAPEDTSFSPLQEELDKAALSSAAREPMIDPKLEKEGTSLLCFPALPLFSLLRRYHNLPPLHP